MRGTWLVLFCCATPLLAQPAEPVTQRLALDPGGVRYLAFRLPAPASREVTLAATTSDARVVEVEPRLTFLAGHALAFLALRPRAAGTARVAAGGRTCTVRVRAPAAGGGPAVRFLAPQHGAALWGRVWGAAQAAGTAPIRSMVWAIDGRAMVAGRGSERIEAVIDARVPGPHVIEVTATDVLGRTGRARCHVMFVRPGAGVLLEAETLARPLPPNSPRAPRRMRDPDAAGGRLALLSQGAHELALVFEASQAGYHQAFVRARGAGRLDLAGPTGMLAAGQVTSRGLLERHPLGAPFPLKAGRHPLKLYFRNFEHGRTLELDQVELRRVGRELPDVLPPQVVLSVDLAGGEAGGAFDVWASARDDGPVKEIELLIDGVPVARRAGRELVHRVPADALRPGAHVLRARAVDAAGNAGWSPRERIERLPYSGTGPIEEWIEPAAPAEPEPAVRGARRWTLRAGGPPLVLPLVVRRAGRHALRLLARATSPVRLRAGVETLLVESPVYRLSAPLRLELGPGRHRLRLALDGPPGAVQLAGAELVEERDDDDRPPWVEIVYPPRGAVVAPGEMVVARVSDAGPVARVELRVGGRTISRSGRSGLVWLFLHGEGLTDGEQRLQVRAVDGAGNVGWSSERPVRLARGGPLSPAERGVHLLRRLALGYNPRELAVLLRDGERAWLARQTGGDPRADGLASYLVEELWLPRSAAGMQRAALLHALHTRLPVRERMALFFDNHFSTWIGKTGMLLEGADRATYRALALSRFDRLLEASAKSPALLVFLDNTRNHRGRPNENYGRELLELHTLGRDAGYTQRDVEETSRILTGWGAARTSEHPWWRFHFEPRAHDTGDKLALGVRFGPGPGGEDARRLLGILAAHPATARRLARKLVAALVEDDPPPRLVALAERACLSSAGDVRAVLRALLADPAFFERRLLSAKLADPQLLVLGLARGRLPALDPAGLDAALDRMGQPPFGCDSPAGWPERESAWLGSAALLARWNLAEWIAPRLELDPLALTEDLVLSLLGARPGPAGRRALRSAGGAGARRYAALLLQLPAAQRR